jgi:hypothetical protein
MNETHSRIEIRHGAVKNKREGFGWLPMVWDNGKTKLDTWSSRGYDRDVAEAMAEDWAKSFASKFIGDWDITIEKTTEGGGAQ